MPDEVTDNQHSIDKLQEQRMLFINFISAAFFGRVCAKGHTGLTGAVYSGQDRVTAFDVHDISLILQPEPMIIRALEEKTRTFNAGNYSHRLLGDAQIDDAILYVQHLLQRQQDFQYADLCSCIVMNYQAAILHHRQHASASLALNFSVTECLIREIFMAYGLVSGSTAKPFATRTHNIKTMSKSAFDRMTSDKLLRILYDGGLINNKYLYERLDSARTKRNALMHKGETISSRDWGTAKPWYATFGHL